jgi:hypothetical protein
MKSLNYEFILANQDPSAAPEAHFPPHTAGYIKPCPQEPDVAAFFCFAVSAMRLSIIAALFLTPALAAVYTDPLMLPNDCYTYIIVGGTSERPRISSAI